MKKSILLVLSLLFYYSGYSQQKKPNIILINIDDMGWRDVGFMGSDFYQTPFLDSLAKRGTIFDQGYATAANCAPSRASMLTGLWQSRHGLLTVESSERGASKDRKIIPSPNTLFLDKNFITFPQILQSNGYQTIHAGKWHISESPLDFGFDQSIGGGPNGFPASYYPPYKNVNWEGPETGYLSDAIITKVQDVIGDISSPYLLYYSPYTVHTPIQGVPELAKKYVDKSSVIGQNNADYASMIENLDLNLARLFSTLSDKGLLDNTLIIFTSDNGGLKGITTQSPLRSGKGSYYEGGIRVPFFIVWEGKIQAETRNQSPISQLDLFPTLLSAAGIQPNQEVDGMDLLPLMTENQALPERPLFWHFPIYLQAGFEDSETRDPLFRTRPGSVIRQGKWKLHYYFETKEIELFDLESDISEKTDLSQTNPEVASRLLESLKKWWEKTNAPIPSQANPEYIGE